MSETSSRPRYALFHKDHPFSPEGVHSGAEMATIHLARSLSRRGADVTVLGRIVTGSAELDSVSYVDLGERYDVASGLSRLASLSARWDALIAVTRADVLVRSRGMVDCDRRILWLQDSDLKETCASLEQIEETVDRIVYVSNGLRRHIEDQGVSASPGAVIPNGFDPEIFHPTGAPFQPRRIVYAGAVVPEKGIDLLIEAFHLLRERVADAELWIYGSPGLWGRAWSFDVDRIRDLEPGVRFAGNVGQHQLASAFRSAAVAVVPSRRSARLEPFPLSAVEAQACGCPVIVSRNGGLPEAILPGKTGLVLDEEDPLALSELLHSLLEDPERLSAMRRDAAEHARRSFDWRRVAESFEGLSRRKKPRRRVERKRTGTRASIACFYVRLPQPDRYGGDFRAFRLLRALAAAGHLVTLVARDALLDPEETERYRALYQSLGIEVKILNRVVQRAGQWVQLPITTLAEALEGRSFDAAWILWWNLALELVPQLRRLTPETRLVVDSVDVAYLRLLRQASVTELREDWLLAAHTRRHELDAYRLADAVITVTEDDRAVLENELPQASVSVVSNVHALADSPRPFAERAGLLFVGFYEHLPNTDAALYFTSRIFPEIRERIPGVKLYLVGNAPPPAVEALAGDDVVVTGYVSDLTPFWQGARVSIAPLRYGAGMKGKIGQALAEGLPVVSTSVGTEGMALTHGKNVLVADEPSEFAEAVVRLYQDPALWHELSEAGRHHVGRHWSDDVVTEHLLDVLLDRNTRPPSTSADAAVEQAEELGLVAEGYEWLSLSAHSAARRSFERVLARNPELAAAYAGLSELEEEAGRDSEALRARSFAVKSAPGHVTSRARLARLLRLRSFSREAEVQIQQATRLSPHHPLVLRELAALAEQSGLTEDAIRLYRDALERRPDDVESLSGAARILARLGQGIHAHRLLLHALDVCRRNPSAPERSSIAEELVAVEASLLPGNPVAVSK